MSFCLECHRKPEDALRPMGEVTNLAWVAKHSLQGAESKEEDLDRIHAEAIGLAIKNKWNVNAGVSCTTCHR